MNLEDLFTVSTLTAAVNKLPVELNQVGSMGLFKEEGVSTTTVTFDVQEGRLVLVPNTSRNADGHSVRSEKPKRKSFELLHLPLTAHVLPSELQNLAPFGAEKVVNQQATVINNKLQALKASIEVTKEWGRVGALRGILLDADGSPLYNWYDEFGVTRESILIDFSVATTDIRAHCLQAKRHAEKKLTGVVVKGYRALCGPGFFDKLTGHAKVAKAYEGWQAAQDRLGGDMRSGFTFGGIEYIEYNAEVSGNKFIPDDVAQMFPLAQGVFKAYNGPANYNETVNTVGLPFYAKSEERKMGKGWDIEVQANPLPICMYPEALVELKVK